MNIQSPILNADLILYLQSESENSFFGKIINSEDNAIERISMLLSAKEKKRPDIGTLLELLICFTKESGKIDFFTRPYPQKNSSFNQCPPCIETLCSIIRQDYENSKEKTKYINEISSIEEAILFTNTFRLRSALKHFISLCQVLKKGEIIESLEPLLNEVDLRLYKLFRGKNVLAKIAKEIQASEALLAKFAELCSWAVLSGALSEETSANAMNALSEKLQDQISYFDTDLIGLLSAAYSICGNPQKSLEYLQKNPSLSNSKDNIGWRLYAFFNLLLGIRAEYYGIKLSPSHLPSLNGLVLKRNFRSKNIEIEIKIEENFNSKNKKIYLSNSNYEADIIHILDLKTENKIKIQA